MLKKIIVVDHEPFSHRKEQHYYISDFENEDVIFEYWQVNKILQYSKNVKYNFLGNSSNIVEFESFKVFLERTAMEDPSSTLFIIEIWPTFQTYYFFRLLKNNNFNWIRIDYYLNPDLILNNRESLNISCISVRNFFSKFKNLVFRFFYNTMKKVFTPQIFFVTGENKSLVNLDTKIVSLDYFDIEEFLIKENDPPILNFKYMVFLDGMILDHPDYYRSKTTKNAVNREEFFDKLNNFFDELEKLMNIPIIIACHPKSNYNNEYRNRQLIINQTSNLVMNSTIVLTHGSLSIDFALMALKPIIYIDYKSFFERIPFLKYLSNRMVNACNNLGSNYFDLEEFNLNNIKLEVDTAKFNKFLNLYYKKNNTESNYT
ncbi:hypothetical protein DRF62_17315, partial [Chryseobacterium piscium]